MSVVSVPMRRFWRTLLPPPFWLSHGFDEAPSAGPTVSHSGALAVAEMAAENATQVAEQYVDTAAYTEALQAQAVACTYGEVLVVEEQAHPFLVGVGSHASSKPDQC